MFVADGGGIDGLHGGELLLQPEDVGFDVMLVIIGEWAGADFVRELGEVGDGAAVEVG